MDDDNGLPENLLVILRRQSPDTLIDIMESAISTMQGNNSRSINDCLWLATKAHVRSPPPSIIFTPEDHAAAEAEGWWLSERSDGYYQIQRFDEDLERRFSTDHAAYQHVSWMARTKGSLLHQKALHLDETLCPRASK